MRRTISVDPEDTPAKLKAVGQQFNARQGRIFDVWKKAFGLAGSDDLTKVVQSVLDVRQ